jgi:cellulose 1,4-beta-cellobiosidase
MSYGEKHVKNKHFCKAKALHIASGMVLLNALFAVQSAHAVKVAKCNQYDMVSITPTSNTYKVHNNVEYRANNSQCINVDNATGNFSVTSINSSSSINYAFISKGCHWVGEGAACTSTTQIGMPKKVSSLLNVTSSWTTIQPSTGTYSAAYSLWFNQTASVTGQPNGVELTIWLAFKGNIKPDGKLIASNVSIAGATWNVWAGSNGKNNVISYVRTSSTKTVSNLNLKLFINDATTRKHVQTSWYLIAVEAGFEIWGSNESIEGLTSSGFSALVE